LGLMITAILQVFVVILTQSVALLADTIHNFSDAFSSIPLFIAFALSRRTILNKKYPYGYGRAEDLAGLFILLLIAGSAVLVFVESFHRLLNPIAPKYLGVLSIAAVIGYLGNEFVARYRIKIGRKIQSEALIADGFHSRTDAYMSLSVLIGAIGAYFGLPIIDPIIGVIIGVMILFILRDASKKILLRIMDGIDPTILSTIEEETNKVENVVKVVDAKARWVGRTILAEVEIIINRDYTVKNAYQIGEEVRKNLKSKLPLLGSVAIKNTPCDHHKPAGFS
jgi:cation diffusion facilitator family transporter